MLYLFHGLIGDWGEDEGTRRRSVHYRIQIFYMDGSWPESEKSAASKSFFIELMSALPGYLDGDLVLAVFLMPLAGGWSSPEGRARLERLFEYACLRMPESLP